jgi:hypothetical protein
VPECAKINLYETETYCRRKTVDNYLVLLFSVNTTNNCFPLWLVQNVSTHMSHYKANLEPLNLSEFSEGPPLLKHGSAPFKTK